MLGVIIGAVLLGLGLAFMGAIIAIALPRPWRVRFLDGCARLCGMSIRLIAIGLLIMVGYAAVIMLTGSQPS